MSSISVDIDSLPDVGATLHPSDLRIIFRAFKDDIRRIRANPLKYGHPPHEVQEQLHMADTRIVLLLAANRVGKSEGGMREILWRARGDHPYKHVKLCNMIWVGCQDFTFYRETTEPKFWEWCPKSWIVGEFHKSEKYVDIRRVDGGICRIQFKTYDQGRGSWQGAGVDVIWLDEEPPEDIYKEAIARLVTTRGAMILTYTPVEGLVWAHDRLYLPLKNGTKKGTLIEGALAEFDEAQPFGVGRSLVPHLTREAILEFAEEIPDEDERAIRIFGQYRKRSGLVYKSFVPKIHVVPAFAIPAHWQVWGAVDPGFHGFAWALFAMSPAGRIYVVAEYFSQGEPLQTRFEAIRDLVYRVRRPPEKPLVIRGPRPVHKRLKSPRPERPRIVNEEPIVSFVDTEDPQTVLELNIKAAEAGVPLAFASLDMGNKAVKAGIMRVQQMLEPKGDRNTPPEVTRERPHRGEPMLYFFDTLKSEWRVGDETYRESRILWEMVRYTWKRPPKGKQVQPDEPDKESAAGAHGLDIIRYGIMARLGAPEELPTQKYEKAGKDAWVWEHLDELEQELLSGEMEDVA